jgi:hypothetical protein
MDYRPLNQAGMWSSSIEQLKGLSVSEQEIAEVVKLKQARVSDDGCVQLVSLAHAHQHPFASADSADSLAGAGFAEPEILEIARADKLDAVSLDAVTLKLTGLSDSALQFVLHRRLEGKPVLSSPQISRLMNTGLTERQILDRIKSGMTDAQAEKEIRTREAERNHANTSFVRVRGRKPH